MNPWLKAALALAAWEAGWYYLHTVPERRALYAAAFAKARELGKPLLIVGAPDGDYGCGDPSLGDVVLDLREAVECPNSVLASVEDIPYPTGYFGAVYCIPDLSDTGAQIQTVRGGRRPSEISVGDKLFTVDLDKGGLVETEVKEVFSREATEYLRVDIGRSRPLSITAEHPVRTKRGWIPAGEIVPGDEVYHVEGTERTAYIRRYIDNPMKRPEIAQKVALKLSQNESVLTRLDEMRKSGQLRRKTKMSAEERAMHSAKMRRHNVDPAFRASANAGMQKRRNGRDIPCTVCGRPFYAAKARIAAKARYCCAKCMWADPAFTSRVMQSVWRLTGPERFVLGVIDELSLPLRYTGDGCLWIGNADTGIKNPDFVVEGQNKVIEVYTPGMLTNAGGRRDPEYAAEREAFFASHGYKALMLDMRSNSFYWPKDNVGARLRQFVSNGLVVKSVRTVRPPSGHIKVFNYRCAPHDSYLVGSVLVHNCSHVIEHVCDPRQAEAELHRVADYLFIGYPRWWQLLAWVVPGHTHVMTPIPGETDHFHYLRIRGDGACNHPTRLGPGFSGAPSR